ncbi:uncharacterized protein LOC144119342 [Amblyomma americanum]
MSMAASLLASLLPPPKPLDTSGNACLGSPMWKKVLKGLGQLKDFEYNVKLKRGAAGVAVPARRVPLALQDKVEAELQRMKEQGVIKKPLVRYQGHIFTEEGLRVDPQRVQDVLQMPAHKSYFVSASKDRLRDLLAATDGDPALLQLRGYAETSWPDDKGDVPQVVRPYWSYRQAIHTQDGLLFRNSKSPVQRLMGRQTRTLLLVPAEHLVPETVPSIAVHNRLQEIRQCQRTYYSRSSRHLPPLSQGQQITTTTRFIGPGHLLPS